MFQIEDVLLLKEDESVKAFARRHFVTLLPRLLLALLLIVIPFFLLFLLFSWGVVGVVVFLILVLSGIILAIRTFLIWDADVLIVSSLRVIDVDQRGLFSRIVSEAPISNIQDVSWQKKGILETIFRMGTVTIQTAGSGVTVKAIRIPRPQEIHELVNDLRRMNGSSSSIAARPAPQPVMEHAPRHEVETRSEKIRKIMSMLERYSPEELTRIEAVLKARERSALTDAFLSNEDAEESDESEDEIEDDEAAA